MTNNINPININSHAIKFPVHKEKEGKENGLVNEKEQKAAVERKKVSAEDVLGFMAASNVDVQPQKVKKVLDISKYVTPEQAARIAGFVQGFEKEVEKGLLAFDSEFPGNKLSDNAKTKIVVDMFDKNNM